MSAAIAPLAHLLARDARQARRAGAHRAGVRAARLQHREPRGQPRRDARLRAHDDPEPRRAREHRADHQAARQVDRRGVRDRPPRRAAGRSGERARQAELRGRAARSGARDREAGRREARGRQRGPRDPEHARHERGDQRGHRRAAPVQDRGDRALGEDRDGLAAPRSSRTCSGAGAEAAARSRAASPRRSRVPVCCARRASRKRPSARRHAPRRSRPGTATSASSTRRAARPRRRRARAGGG